MSSNTFASALSGVSNIVYGDNGGEMKETSGDYRVDAFTNLTKDTSVETITDLIYKMIRQIEYSDNKGEIIADIFRIWVHKRHAREGEKEKLLSYRYFLELYNIYPETCVEIVKKGIFGEIGYWKDLYLIWGIINDMELSDSERYRKYNRLIEAIRYSILTQRDSDLQEITGKLGHRVSTMNNDDLEKMVRGKEIKFSISYVGKYCVREKSPYNKKLYWYIKHGNSRITKESNVSYMIRGTLKTRCPDGSYSTFPLDKQVPFNAKKTYRNLNTKLNIVLNVPESMMCANRFGEMDPPTFPSVFMKKNTKGLLNEHIKKPPTSNEEITGNRHPYDEGRVTLRKKMREMFSDPSKINSGQLFPHEIMCKYTDSASSLNRDMYAAIWDSKIMDTNEKLMKVREKLAKEFSSSDKISRALTSGNFIGCADVSGSMTMFDKVPNRPIDIAVGLTLFMSEIASPAFRHLALSFTDSPRVFSFANKTLGEKYSEIMKYVGYSTNYEGLHRALIELCVNKNVKEEDIPIIVVYTDGNFNCMDNTLIANGGWRTIHSKIMSMWVAAGYRKMPTIVYWNLNGNSNGLQEDTNYQGVMFLQGRSATNIKYILYGECAEETIKEVDGKEVKVSSITPYEIFRKAMDQEYFRAIEDILRQSDEKHIRYFS